MEEPEERDLSDFDDEEEEEEIQETPEELGTALIKASAKGDLDTAEAYLAKGADPNFRDNRNWTALMWAAAQGHEVIVSLLLANGASMNYKAEEDATDTNKIRKASEIGRYNPLHWAAFNGHNKVVWTLLRKGFSPLDIDMYGNNSIHQAAAGGRLQVMECFLSFGVDVDAKNARGHKPIDLATDGEVRTLIQSASKVKYCTTCERVFDFTCPRFLCQVSKKFYCRDCSESSWVYESIDSEEQERPVCRSNECQAEINNAQDSLQTALSTNNFERVDEAINHILTNEIDIDVKLFDKGKIEHERLRTEGVIARYLDSIAYVEDYKTIQKSVNVITDMLDDAKVRDVKIDLSIVQRADSERDRLTSERNLRHQTSIAPIGVATNEDVQRLEELISIAQEKTVAEEYIRDAEVLSGKMQNNINAHHIMALFLDYPLREYPEPEQIDPKTKRPVQQKPAAPPPKKRRREPKFIIPEWATELAALIKQVETIEGLLKMQEELELSEDFMAQAKENIIRMKKEIRFRKQQEEEARLAAEKKAAARRKK